MIKTKMVFAIAAVILFLTIAMAPATATFIRKSEADQEYKTVYTVMNKLFDNIEYVENDEQLIKLIQNCFTNELLAVNPVLREIFKKIIQWIFSSRSLSIGNIGNSDRNLISGDKLNSALSKQKFIISFGSYSNRFPNIGRDEKPTIFKRGFAYWRYSDAARLIKGRTIIAERGPFKIDQRVQGSQIGVLLGFSGLFIDIESKLTGNSYVFIMGNARRARALNFRLFSK
ncbi:MAG: hypothetical protein R6V50_04930 [Thermoplasmatota archaeon]